MEIGLQTSAASGSKIKCFWRVGNGTVNTGEGEFHQIITGNCHSEVCVLGHIVIMVHYVSENKILGI